MVGARDKHNRYQNATFDAQVDFFKQAIPSDVQQRLQAIVSAAELTASSRVLDVGTGTGALIPYIKDFSVSSIVGCDLSSAMLEEASTRHPDVRFWCGDVVDLPRDLGKFNVIFFNAMFGNIWNQRDALRKAIELLCEGGLIIISHPMGAGFVRQLAQQDPVLVPHTLPSDTELASLIKGLLLDIRQFNDVPDLYLCVLQYHP